MRLLTAKEILESVQTLSGPLQIGNFAPECLQHTSYYVRLGSQFLRMDDQELHDVPGVLNDFNPVLEFEPSEFVVVRSHEAFRLSATVMGILGGVSDASRQGFSLVAGQFIDPIFPGPAGGEMAQLQFGLKNLSRRHAALRWTEVVAKVCFFDVSDSATIELLPGSLAEAKFSERRIHAMDAQIKPHANTD